MNLIEAWSKWEPEKAPYILEADRESLSSCKSEEAIVTYRSWKEAYSSPGFQGEPDSRLHLGLFPQPFKGDVLNASIYILLLNPGLSPTDYYGEYQVPGFREAMLLNHRQDFSNSSLPFIFLDPQFSWHGGFEWWNRKLKHVISAISKHRKVTFNEARKSVAQKIASIELFPYHSRNFKDADKWLKNLPSVQLAREFVNDVVLSRVRSGKAVTIITRKAKEWSLPEIPGIITYTAGQARSASLSPNTAGGKAILKQFNIDADGPKDCE
jgi:hypothetical protein